MMDRERKDELPQMQVGFIDVICLPLYRVLSDTFPWVRPLYQGTLENRKHWQDLAEKVEMGLTWIDHDTIDKPVEAITGNIQILAILFLLFFYHRFLFRSGRNKGHRVDSADVAHSSSNTGCVAVGSEAEEEAQVVLRLVTSSSLREGKGAILRRLKNAQVF